jgi:poly(3-hydroxybutyrate) depolymerase
MMFGKHLLTPAWTGAGESAKLIRNSLNEIGEHFCLDFDRIYLFTNGGGGKATGYLACREWVRGLAVSAYFPSTAKRIASICRRPKPVFLRSARDSRWEPTDGSAGCVRDARLSLADYEAAWTTRNECRGEPLRTQHKNGYCDSWSSCSQPVTSCVVDGGLPWPMGNDPRRARCAEPAPAEFGSTALMWEFFEAAEQPGGR